MQTFTLIIPTLNEAGNIAPLLTEITRVCQANNLLPEIIFVDDDSTDTTRDEIASADVPFSVQCIHRKDARGLTGAVIAGATAASNEYIIVMDGDLSHPPDTIPELLTPLLSGNFDMSIGSRYVIGGDTEGWSALRLFGSRMATNLARLITPVTDPLSGFFGVHRERLLAVNSGLGGFKIGLELLASGQNQPHCIEVPISFRDRHAGDSKMNAFVLLQYLRQLLRLSLHTTAVQRLLTVLFCGLFAGLFDTAIFRLLISNDIAPELAHFFAPLIPFAVCFLSISQFLPAQATTPGFNRRILPFVLITLFGLLARGGMFSLALFNTSQPSLLALAAYLTSSSIIWLCAFYFSCSPLSLWGSSRERRILGLWLLGYALLLHLIYMGGIELIQEEAYYWNYSQHPAPGYLDHPPMIALLIGLGTHLFGSNEFGVRFGALLCWFITGFFVYRLGRELFGKESGFASLLLAAVLPVYFGVGFFATPDAPLISCWAGLLLFLSRALLKNQSSAWYGAGIAFGLGLSSKYTIAFMLPAILLFMAVDRDARKWLLRREPWIAALLALLIFSPTIWWNAHNQWASFLFQSTGRLAAKSTFSTHVLLSSILLLLSPIGVISLLSIARPSGLFLKLFHQNKKAKRIAIFCAVMASIPLAIILLFSLTKEVKLNWSGPLWLAILPILAQTMYIQKKSNLLARSWPPALAGLLMIYGVLFYYLGPGIPGIPYASGVFLSGYPALSRAVEKQVHAATRPGNSPPIVVGLDLYKTTSGLAFYTNKQAHSQDHSTSLETAGRHLLGENDLMYQYWLKPEQASGRDLFLVSRKKAWLANPHFLQYGSRIGKIHRLQPLKRGKEMEPYYFRVLKNYHPLQPDLLAQK